MNQQIKTSVGVIIILIITATAGMFIWKIEKNQPEINQLIPPIQKIQNKRDKTENSTMCTQEAKQCSDGSYVSRTGSNCEFAECPKADNLVGGDKDEHGCIGSAGYVWCEDKQKCLKSWEEKCDSLIMKIKEPDYQQCKKYSTILSEYGKVTQKDLDISTIIGEEKGIGKVCEITIILPKATTNEDELYKDKEIRSIIEKDGWKVNYNIAAGGSTGDYEGYEKDNKFMLYEYSFEPKLDGGWENNAVRERLYNCGLPPGGCFSDDELQTVISLSFGIKE
jgi:hypothetical protein